MDHRNVQRDSQWIRRSSRLGFATKLGIKLRQYQYIEKGTRRPSYEVLCAFENLFGMTHRELLEKIDEL
ncbi:helix-turn-helix domain-containing protein [Paenibacillus popilliae]|uniref:helix-turn-helix domain-containing protein n=1 Tax=Paenibacillus popilliae TaxID=78057 RepID=UPI001F241CF9|nr:helix-turn-helix transcriptional regulator [Paenibacillus popilliae]